MGVRVFLTLLSVLGDLFHPTGLPHPDLKRQFVPSLTVTCHEMFC